MVIEKAQIDSRVVKEVSSSKTKQTTINSYLGKRQTVLEENTPSPKKLKSKFNSIFL